MILHKIERESIITFNEEELIATVFTYSKPLIRVMEKKFGLKPKIINDFGGREYIIDKDRIKFNLPRTKKSKLTKIQKEKLSENLKKARSVRDKNKIKVTVKKKNIIKHKEK